MEFPEAIRFMNNAYEVLINITSLCNLNCYSCSSGCTYSNTNSNFLSLIQLEKNLKKLKSLGSGLKLIIFSGGEPLLHPQFIDLCKITNQIFFETPIIVFTNGILLKQYNEENLIEFQKLNVKFSISLYPIEEMYNEIFCTMEKLEKYNLTTSLIDKGRPLFYKNTFHENNNINNTDHFFSCSNNKQKFFTIIDDKIFGCNESIFFYNLNLEFSSNDYKYIEKLQSENEIFELKAHPHSMCKKCSFSNSDGQGYIIWHTQNEISSNFKTSLLELFLYEYENYLKLINNNQRLINCLKNPNFDFSIMKNDSSTGYERMITRYFNGIADVNILIDNSFSFLDIAILKEFLQQQKKIKKMNIYIYCENLNLEQQKKIFQYFSPTLELNNIYIFKNSEDIINNSYCNKYITLNASDFQKLKDKAYIINNLMER